ncbi:hypothetical protein [Ilyomonas limi]|uniref:hypothetical protein n=1 Tax=Ilyomonas limi TaxID=2575867 RepID=UPI001484E5EA|nr:hypothetical protein [Ilyomonas limi]
MCTIIQGEIKKSCCSCGGFCKSHKKLAEKMSSITKMNEAVTSIILLQKDQSLQHSTSAADTAKHYEKSNHFRFG